MERRDSRIYSYKIKDPYIDRSLYKDPTICPTCGLIYHEKRWRNDPELIKNLKENKKKVHSKECPACRKIKDRYPLGIVEIEGEFVKEKNKEIHARIKHIASEEFNHNPLERIIEVQNSEGKITIATTTEHLAEKIGKKISKTFHKNIKISFSEEEKLVRVYVSE